MLVLSPGGLVSKAGTYNANAVRMASNFPILVAFTRIAISESFREAKSIDLMTG